MGWFKEKVFGKQTPYMEELAENLYEALVLEGGPSAEAEDRIDAVTLEIPLGKLESFAQKRLISLEAMLFVATQLETVEKSTELQHKFGDAALHPLAVEIGKVTGRKWRERGIDIAALDVGERCFDEVETFLEKPFAWGRHWLEEFYDDPEKAGEHYILWTEQWLREFKVLRHIVSQNL